MDRAEFLLWTQQHFHANIQFADQKASVLIGLNGAVIAAIHALDAFRSPDPLVTALGLTGSVFLSLAILAAIWVIMPRGKSKSPHKRFSDPNCAHRYQDALEYADQYSRLSDAELVVDLAHLVYERSEINRDKYTALRISLWAALVGWSFALLAALLVIAG